MKFIVWGHELFSLCCVHSKHSVLYLKFITSKCSKLFLNNLSGPPTVLEMHIHLCLSIIIFHPQDRIKNPSQMFAALCKQLAQPHSPGYKIEAPPLSPAIFLGELIQYDLFFPFLLGFLTLQSSVMSSDLPPSRNLFLPYIAFSHGACHSNGMQYYHSLYVPILCYVSANLLYSCSSLSLASIPSLPLYYVFYFSPVSSCVCSQVIHCSSPGHLPPSHRVTGSMLSKPVI